MNWARVWAIILNVLYRLRNNLETWIDLLWFPMITVVVFGYFAQYVSGGDAQAVRLIVSGFVFWEVARLMQYTITVGMMWEVWSRSLSAIFVSPITMKEFLVGQAIAGFFTTMIMFFFLWLVSILIFGFSLHIFGLALLVYIVQLCFFGVGFGMLVMGLILRFGTNIQSLAWGLIYVFQPLAAIFYPVEALPRSVQWMSYLIPITYIMQSVRNQLAGGPIVWSAIGFATLFNVCWFVVSVWFLYYSFNWSKRSGAFARMGL